MYFKNQLGDASLLRSFRKPFVIIPLLVISTAIIVYLVIHILFGNISKWKYCVEDFETYRKDFEIVTDFCQEYIVQNEALENERIIFVYDFKEKELLCDWENVDVSDAIKKSFEKIKEAFPNKDAQFDSVTVAQGKIYFETHNGLYSVVYSDKETPKLVDGVNKGKSRRIYGNWYHVVKK